MVHSVYKPCNVLLMLVCTLESNSLSPTKTSAPSGVGYTHNIILCVTFCLGQGGTINQTVPGSNKATQDVQTSQSQFLCNACKNSNHRDHEVPLCFRRGAAAQGMGIGRDVGKRKWGSF